MQLDQLPLGRAGRIAAIDWPALDEKAGRRLRELGVDDGVAVEALHRGAWRGPIACRIGRMVVAIRRTQAAAIRVDLR